MTSRNPMVCHDNVADNVTDILKRPTKTRNTRVVKGSSEFWFGYPACCHDVVSDFVATGHRKEEPKHEKHQGIDRLSGIPADTGFRHPSRKFRPYRHPRKNKKKGASSLLNDINTRSMNTAKG